MSTTTGKLSINGAEIHYEEEGSGPALVFVHAGIADRRMWRPQVATFAADHRVITYDMRGFGQSPRVAGPFAHYRDLIGLLDALKIDRSALVGCSKGGGVVVDAALAAPDRITGLVLSGSIPHGFEMDEYPEDPPEWNALVAAYEAGDLGRTNELEVAYWLDGVGQTPGRADASIQELVTDMNSIVLRNEASGIEISEEVLDPKAGKRLSKISQPTLLIVGDLDEPIILMANDILVAQLPDAQQVIIPGTAHLPNMEQPAEFNRALREFLEGIHG